MKNIPLFLFICLSISLQAQETLDTNPASIKWYQINTPGFRLLFPGGFEDQAQRMANTLQRVRGPESRTMGGEPRKISVILQSQSAVSNGFVTITPRHSEFYAMPSQNYNFLGTNDWLNLLASHEYRHVVQYQHANRGFSRLFYYLFGSNTLAAMAHIGAPMWFWEGDAVATETAFTHSGRGRIPYFNLVFKTNLMEGRTFNYHKQYLRSYKNNIPDHYVLGYNMISYLRRRTNDPMIWEKITGRSWNVPFIPFTFSNAIKHETGLYVTQLYREMAANLKKEWQHEIDQLTLTSFERINNRRSQTYTDYLYPQSLNDGSVVAMKSGIGNIEQFVRFKDGKEMNDFIPGFINETGMLSTANSKVVWSEFGYDPRWSVRNYSLIKTYDFETHRKKIVGSHHDRLAGACLSPDGTKVAAVRTDKSYRTTLVIFDTNTAGVIREFENPTNDFISMSRWTPDGKKIIALRTTREGRTISLFDFEAGNFTDLLPMSRENVGYPVMVDHYILYGSPITGIDNIFAFDLETKTKYQITSSKYGAYNPAISGDGKTLYYNDQSRNGLDVVKVSFDPSQWKRFDGAAGSSPVRIVSNTLAEQEGRPDLLDSIPQQHYDIRRYSRAKGILNPYSWGAYVDNTLAQASVGIISQDILSTTLINAGYQFDINERTGLWKAGLSYQGFYPIIDASVTYGDRKQKTSIFDRDVKFTWKETSVLAGLRVPLVLTNSKYITQLQIGNSIGVTKVSSFKNEVTQHGELISTGNNRIIPVQGDSIVFISNDRVDGTLLSNIASISFIRSLKMSRRDFNPRFGQYLDFENYNTPYGGNYKGSLWVLRGTIYFPGIFKHHSLYFRGGYQSSFESYDVNTYTFRNRLFKPRGYAFPRNSKFYTIGTNYALPLWYPDISIGPLLNIQRVRTNFFYDFGKGEGYDHYYDIKNSRVYFVNNAAIYNSFGVETTFDVNLIRFLPQFNMGVRTTYITANKFNKSGFVFEFLIGNIPF